MDHVAAGVPVLTVRKRLVSECSLIYAAPMSPRASALPPAERRVSIVRAALRLIAANGTMPTTREIAEVVRALDQVGVEATELTFGEPTLDDVYLALADQAASRTPA